MDSPTDATPNNPQREARDVLMKIITVILINYVYTCIRMSAEDDNFPREGGGRVYLMILF